MKRAKQGRIVLVTCGTLGQSRRIARAVVSKRLGQGNDERLHPGTPTFGNMAIFSRTGQGVESDTPPSNPAEKNEKGSGS